MNRKFAGSLTVAMLCVVVTVASGATRGGARGGQSAAGRKPPGGAWSEYNPGGRQGGEKSAGAHNQSGAGSAAAGHATGNRNPSQASGAQGAAAGAAAEHHNAPAASGAEGAAAGHAVSKNNATGAQGAAAGAAATNRNAPAASGAQGAAAGYAAGQNNAPQVSGAQGAAAGAAVANNNAPAASGAQGAVVGAAVASGNSATSSSGADEAAAGLAAVRSTANHQGMYGAQWQSDHPNAWTGANWAAGAAWAPATWNAVVGHCGYDNHPPVQYNYGANVTCVSGNVVVDGQPAGTAEVFSQEAANIAESGTDTATTAADQWLPLGVFALVRNEHQHPQLIMQLAVNQHGVIRGNYTDQVTDTTLPVHGGVDGPTKRAAWTVGDNRYVVMEAGLSNLTQNEVPALIHKNGTTQRWILVRLPEPAPSGSAATPAAAPQ